MHNLPMHRPGSNFQVRRGVRPLVAVLLALFLALAACGGNADPESENSESAGNGGETGEASSEEPYLPVPEDVELSAQGSQLDVGDTAVVAYEPRQDDVAALEITVTKLVDADFGDFVGWKLTPQTRETNPYFVEARVKNVGETDLGGEGVPLYAVDGNNKLIEASTFQSTFKPCSPEAFPQRFKSGDAERFCLVYLAPDRGELTAVSFRPVEEFNPITWTGELEKTGAKKKGGQKKGDGRRDNRRGNQGGGNQGGGNQR